MKEILDKKTTPPGGWIYVEPTTEVEFKHTSYEAIITMIRKHKRAMDLPIAGNWQDIVDDLMVKHNPRIRHKEAGVKEKVITSDDILNFIVTLKEIGHTGLVPEEEQDRRAKICLQCPKKGVVNCKGCGWLARQLIEYQGDRKLPVIKDIYKQSCMACGCDLTAKTAVPMDVLKKVDDRLPIPPDYQKKTSEFPGCWMLEDES